MIERKVRVRFAPSPTGPLHIGGVRTALFNYLFAKKHGGSFLLRIEDTDQTRFVPGAEEYIMESLAWCGIKFDEGIREGGEYGPYRQSDRKNLYREYADRLIESGMAYYAFDTPEELEAMRNRLKEEKSSNQQYNALTRNSMKNSLSLSQTEVKQLLDQNHPYVVRFKLPENENIAVTDLIRGEVIFNTSQLDDKVLFKSDGMPTYHLANVVDDYLMKISHVIRGEEWLPSLPLHVLLYKALGWENVMPQFAHLSLILKPDGKGKLSKRDGDRMGFPVFPTEWRDPESGEISNGYRESGYFNDAFINMLAFLGWNPGTEQELFTMEELIQAFSIEHVGKAGAKFDPEKAKWFNHQYMLKNSDEEIAASFQILVKSKGFDISLDFLTKVCKLTKERVNFISEIWDQAYFFFQAPQNYDVQSVKKNWKAETTDILKELNTLLTSIDDLSAEKTEPIVKQWVTDKGYGFGKVMNPLRIALVGTTMGPHLFDIMELIGKQEVLNRIAKAIDEIKV